MNGKNSYHSVINMSTSAKNPYIGIHDNLTKLNWPEKKLVIFVHFFLKSDFCEMYNKKCLIYLVKLRDSLLSSMAGRAVQGERTRGTDRCPPIKPKGHTVWTEGRGGQRVRKSNHSRRTHTIVVCTNLNDTNVMIYFNSYFYLHIVNLRNFYILMVNNPYTIVEIFWPITFPNKFSFNISSITLTH